MNFFLIHQHFLLLQSSNLVYMQKFLHFPVAPSPETQRSNFISRQNIAITEISRTTNNRTRQTLLLANNRS